jgi:hypothetical protein
LVLSLGSDWSSSFTSSSTLCFRISVGLLSVHFWCWELATQRHLQASNLCTWHYILGCVGRAHKCRRT